MIGSIIEHVIRDAGTHLDELFLLGVNIGVTLVAGPYVIGCCWELLRQRRKQRRQPSTKPLD